MHLIFPPQKQVFNMYVTSVMCYQKPKHHLCLLQCLTFKFLPKTANRKCTSKASLTCSPFWQSPKHCLQTRRHPLPLLSHPDNSVPVIVVIVHPTVSLRNRVLFISAHQTKTHSGSLSLFSVCFLLFDDLMNMTVAVRWWCDRCNGCETASLVSGAR